MAYAKRGSRPITVDQLNFRWRVHERGEVSVWHVLDAGLLRILPPPGVQWGFDPTPSFVARAIQLARHRGWSTTDHLELPLGHAAFAELVGYGPASRTGSLEQMLDRQIELLGMPELPPAPCLRVTLLPRGRPLVMLDLSADRLVVHGVIGTELVSIEGACDPTWLGDILVEVRETEQTSALGPAARVDVRDPGGEICWRGSMLDPFAKVAAQGAWRAAWQALDDDARAILEDLHPHLDLPEPPWVVSDPEQRRVRLFGVLRAARVPAFAKLLSSGGWIVDARRLIDVEPEARALLQAERGLGDLWVLPESHGLERPWRSSPKEAAEARPLRVRLLLALRVAAGFDPRWAARAGAAISKGHALADLDRWLAPVWVPCEAPAEAVWCSGPALHHQAPPAPWLAMNRDGVFVCVEEGEVRTLRTRYEAEAEA